MTSGCGVFDGAEIHEATLTLYFLHKAGAQAVCLAPKGDQRDVIDHRNGHPLAQTRSLLTEAARIPRGDITPIGDIDPDEIEQGLIDRFGPLVARGSSPERPELVVEPSTEPQVVIVTDPDVAEGFAQVTLAAPVVLAAGDRFLLRLPSPVRTLGGGTADSEGCASMGA